ncbi:transposase [Bradyrhizobium sp. IC4060]|nr:transposase [Bradyrhizobium sp. IC4060]MCA1484609.1 transposase [Bradyrhizobium sp. IC4061]
MTQKPRPPQLAPRGAAPMDRDHRHPPAWTGADAEVAVKRRERKARAISKRGNRQLQTLSIVCVTSIIKLAKRGLKVPLWIQTLLQRRPVNVVSVALANKVARTIWALLVRGGIYQEPAAMLKT